ncbi:MAG: TIGR03862 family flavoprotein [Zoogloeaceae bacterium]|nr:TIGR03862 family flavoprotein [Zoogloeaceae bacterium]
MAAEALAARGIRVDLFDAMPSVARKFLLAGKGGMNITHGEDFATFLTRYGLRRDALHPLLAAFGPAELRQWIHGLGIDTFVGSSGRVFPTDMKAAPLLRAWLHRLRGQGVHFHVRHRWLGWDDRRSLRFATPEGERLHSANTTVLALGGGSWQRLGSDGAWQPLLAAAGVDVAPLKPSNCGFIVSMEGAEPVDGWSPHFRERFAGEPVKAIAARASGKLHWQRGEFLVNADGIEGSLVYALSAALRDTIEGNGAATLEVDLLPDFSAERVAAEISKPRGSRSLSSHLQSRLGLKGVKTGLLREVLSVGGFNDPQTLASTIKHLPIRLKATRPLDEAISSAGGVRFEALDSSNSPLMLKALPGTFCAGEMLDWEAPTGGYLLTGCFSTGFAAGKAAANWLQRTRAATTETASS